MANGPEHGNFYTNRLECQDPLIKISAHLDTVWHVQKIVQLSLYDETLSIRLFTKVLVTPYPN